MNLPTSPQSACFVPQVRRRLQVSQTHKHRSCVSFPTRPFGSAKFILRFTRVVSTARSPGSLSDVPLCACTTVCPFSNHESLILPFILLFFFFFKENLKMTHTQTPEAPWVLPRGQLRHQARGGPDRRTAELGPRRAWAPPRVPPAHSPLRKLS